MTDSLPLPFPPQQQDVLDTALIDASKLGRLAQVQLLLTQRANVHARDDLALTFAAHRGRLDVVQCLLSAGAHANVHNHAALRWAAKNGHLNVVRLLLLSAGSYVHAADCAALRWAAQNGHLDVVQCLMDAGSAFTQDQLRNLTFKVNLKKDMKAQITQLLNDPFNSSILVESATNQQ